MDRERTLRVVLNGEVRELKGLREATLSELMQEAGFAAPTPCGGNGRCGKCRVRAAGELSPAPDETGSCLACQTKLVGEAVVWLDSPQRMEAIEGMGALPEFERDPLPGEYGLAVDIGTTTLAAQMVSLKDGRVLGAVTAENPQRLVAHDVIGRTKASLEGKRALLRDLIRVELIRMENVLCEREGIARAQVAKPSARATRRCSICSPVARRIRWRTRPSRPIVSLDSRRKAFICRRASAHTSARTSSARWWPAI